MLKRSCSGRLGARFRIFAVLGLLTIGMAFSTPLFAQTTISTGSIQGSVADQSGASMSGAKVTITQKSTGRVLTATTTSSGSYASGALTPGDYIIRVEAAGFKTSELAIVVEVGVTATGNVKLEIGQVAQVVELQADTLQVNTEQATVEGVINTAQIENLPING